ncbi:MAG: NifB/NifX family molybdenum-iron cluster-binding protein [Gammaproteobacteria bacterium]|jgi:predicted Fe-Mo cluster-binding NifX family protein
MKICITAQGKDLNSKVESRFGRSPYFIIYDIDTADFEVIENPNLSAASGVGVKSGQLVADKKVSVVLTGKVGPKASDALNAAGIKIISDVSGTVKEAVEKFQSEDFKAAEKSQEQETQTGNWFDRCCRRLFGFGRGRGRSKQSSGMGRGQGQGRRGFAGPGGYCVCTSCGEKVKHQPGVPCRSLNCPKCGAIMARE